VKLYEESFFGESGEKIFVQKFVNFVDELNIFSFQQTEVTNSLSYYHNLWLERDFGEDIFSFDTFTDIEERVALVNREMEDFEQKIQKAAEDLKVI